MVISHDTEQKNSYACLIKPSSINWVPKPGKQNEVFQTTILVCDTKDGNIEEFDKNFRCEAFYDNHLKKISLKVKPGKKNVLQPKDMEAFSIPLDWFVSIYELKK